jgi:hypothetical protein
MDPDHDRAVEEFELQSALYRNNTLDRWLSYEGYQPLLWGGGFFLPVGLVAIVATLASVVFIPIMVRDLAVLGHRRWIVGWVVWVAIPSMLVLLLGSEQNRLLIASFVFLPLSYIYFWALKLAVDTWTGQLTARLEFIRRELDREQAMPSQL